MFLRMVYDDKLAEAAYLIGCQRTGEAIVIDPERDVDRYEKIAAANGLRIVAVAETHIHADFISGGRELAEKGAKVYVSDEGDADWKYQWLDKKVGGGEYDYRLLKDGDTLVVAPSSSNRRSRERHGLSRTLVANMVEGVSQGFTRKLEIVGVGYRASVQGTKLVVLAGYSHPVEMVPPDGVTFAVENNTNVLVSGANKELVGNEAAKVRAIRPPEPYKGKGIKYEGERILRKAGKTGKK